MSKRQLFMVIGVWVAVFLFLGLPSFWHQILAVLTGIGILVLAYTLKPDFTTGTRDMPFVDHKTTESQPSDPISNHNQSLN